MRVDSSAQRSSSASSPAATRASTSGVERELRERPAERGEQVRHRGDVEQHDVAGDALRALRLVGVGPAARDLVEEAGGVGAVVAGTASSSPTAVSKRASAARSACLSADATAVHARRVHERVGAVELVELGDQAVEPRRLGGAIADPARQAEPVADPPGEAERVDRARGAELGQLEIERVVEVAEIRLDVLGAEEVVRERAHAGEQLLGQLAHEHAVVGEALARVALGERVERAQRLGREHEEVAIAARHDLERVAELGAGPFRARRPDR